MIALDLGAGSMNDSIYLLENEFRSVVAIDTDDAAMTNADTIHDKRFTFFKTKFQDFAFEENVYDLITAQYALPFLSPDEFQEVFPKILLGLKKDGVFCGQFFGNRDSWTNNKDTMNFHTLDEIARLFAGLEIIKLEEEEKDGITALGNKKHWHVFHVIAIK